MRRVQLGQWLADERTQKLHRQKQGQILNLQNIKRATKDTLRIGIQKTGNPTFVHIYIIAQILPVINATTLEESIRHVVHENSNAH